MLWITLIWLRNGANLPLYEHVTHFVPNIRHKAYCDGRRGDSDSRSGDTGQAFTVLLHIAR